MKTIMMIIATVLFALSSIRADAQKNMQDVVYLKNGSIIRGIITDSASGSGIKIAMADGSVFVFQRDEIEKITREKNKLIYDKRSGTFVTRPEPPPNKGIGEGYVARLEFANGPTLGKISPGVMRMKMNFIHGYRVNPHLAVAAGTGLNVYPGNESAVLIPLYADFRVHALDKGTSPYFGFALGYTFAAVGNDGILTPEGLICTPSIGISTRTRERRSVYVGFEYELKGEEWRTYYGNDYSHYTTETVFGQTLRFNFGFTF